jgi:hypothetical protein
MARTCDLRRERLALFLGHHPGCRSSDVRTMVYGDLPRKTGFRRLTQAESAGLVTLWRCDEIQRAYWSVSCPDGRHRHVWPTVALLPVWPA